MRGESIAVHRVIPLTLILSPVQRGRGKSFMGKQIDPGEPFFLYS